MDYKTNFELVREFLHIFGNYKNIDLCEELITEEFKEVKEAWAQGADRAQLVKELIDLLYVTYGALTYLNVPADLAFAEVHRSNMSKLGEDGKPIYRGDGKVLKGPNYSPANMEVF